MTLDRRHPRCLLDLSLQFFFSAIEAAKLLTSRRALMLKQTFLSRVIRLLRRTVRAGELDELFNQAAKTGSIGKARKAA
jgi:hypothetical protein